MKAKLATVCLAVLMLADAGASQQVDALKDIDQNFSGRPFPGCDQQTWDSIHTAQRASILREELPPSTAKDDDARATQITHCTQLVSNRIVQVVHEFQNSIQLTRKMAAMSRDNVDPSFLIADADNNERLLEEYNQLEIMESEMMESGHVYMDHSGETIYQDLVRLYNKLAYTVNLAPECDNRVHAHPLHCEASTNSVTGITQMDCQ